MKNNSVIFIVLASTLLLLSGCLTTAQIAALQDPQTYKITAFN